MHPRVAALLATVMVLAVLTPSATAVAGNFGNFGAKVTTASGDFVNQLAALPGTKVPCLVREEAGVAAVPSDDNYFIHFDADATCDELTKSVADVQVAGGTPGTLVTSTTGSYAAVVDSSVIELRYLEVDGKLGFSDGDWLYIDADQNGALSVGDIRIYTPTSAGVTPPTARYVNSGEFDIAEAGDGDHDMPTSATLVATAFTLGFFDANYDATWSTGDTLVAIPPGGNARFLSPAQVFISASGGRTHGGIVSAASPGTGALPILAPVTGAFLATTTAACTNPLSADIYLHFGGLTGGAYTHIQVGDLILRKGGDTTTGAASQFWTRVSSTATGAGAAIQASSPVTAANFFYVNNPSSPTGFTSADWLYLDLGGICGASTGSFTAGDLRLTASNGGSSFGTGTMVVAGNSDLTTYGAATLNDASASPAWYLLHRNVDQALGRPLVALTNGKFNDANVNGRWDGTGEAVYIAAGASVAAGDKRLYHATLPDSTTNTVTTVLAGDADVTTPTALTALSKFWVTGPDGILDAGAGEVVVHSADAWMTPGFDRAVIPVGGIAETLALTATETEFFGAVGSSDQHILQWARTGQATASPIHHSHDAILGTSPTFVTATSVDHAPTLTAIATPFLARLDRTDGSPSEDAYYLKTGAAPPPLQAATTIRMSPYDSSRPAGILLASSDTQELGSGGSVLASTTTFENSMRYIDQGPTGLDPSDPLYVDLPTDVGGQNAGTFGFFDIRMSGVTINSVTYTAGSLVQPADQDRTGFSTVWGAYGGGNGHRLYFFDENRDGTYNGDDVMYAAVTTAAPAAFVVPDLLSVRLQGPGGATSNTAPPVSGGGGNPPPVVTTTSTTTGTTTSGTTTDGSTTDGTTTSGTTSSGGGGGGSSLGSEAAMNRLLEDSLDVDRKDGQNVLTWDDVGADSYQIWSHDSPYALEDEVPGSQTSYSDDDGDAKTNYLVTACIGPCTLTAADVNDGDVPGYDGVPKGEDASPPKGFIPGPSPVLLLGFVALAALLVRRRLA